MSHLAYVMPTTAERRWCLPLALQCFLDQDYEDRSLYVLSDGGDTIADLIPEDPRIHHRHRDGHQPNGAKWNELHHWAIDDGARFIAVMADDDWQAPTYGSARMKQLEAGHHNRIGCRSMLFYRCRERELLLYTCQREKKPWWVTHGSLIIRSSAWLESGGYPVQQPGADSKYQDFLRDTQPDIFRDWRGYVAVHHGGNSYNPDFTPSIVWGARGLDELASIMGRDYAPWCTAWGTR